ncbi:MAG: LysR substrate-binding domain-containing protein [Spirochaetota bacterium]
MKEANFNYLQLKYFLEIQNEKSITRASRKLHKGQSTLSHHLMQLEEMLGVSLISRNSKNFALTPEGVIFKEFCEKVMLAVEHLHADLKTAVSGGVTRIVASTIPSGYLLPPILSKILKEYPDYFFHIDVHDSREAIDMVREGYSEIGIVGKKVIHPSLTYRRIISDIIVLIGNHDYPDRLTVNDLTGLPFINREHGSGTLSAYMNALKKHDVYPSNLKIVAECHTSESVKEMVSAGLGVAFISNLCINNELRLKRLKKIDVDGLRIERDFFMVHQNKKQFSPPAQLIYDTLCSLQKG